MTKTITISDDTYELIKEQIEKDKKESNKVKLQIKIKNTEGGVLFESEETTIKEAVEEAVSRGIHLMGADLEGADLRGANLEGAELFYAKFYGKGGSTKIKKNQVDDFFKALGVVVEE